MAALTVLMPVYNAERFVAEAIESILQQTFQDFEFLIIDDGSTDQTAAIVTGFDDCRIKFVQNERNLGISATLNNGIELAIAPLIARMDADDISLPQRLQKQYDYMQAHPDCAMVSSLVKVITEEGKLVRVDSFKSEYFYYNLTFICWIYHPTVMYRKDAVKEVGMYSVPYAEDFELFWQLSRSHKIYNLPEILLHYRISGQSLHQVLKKQEYEKAQHEQLLRNFRYYAGSDFTMPDSHLECLQHNFKPLLEESSATSVLKCLHQLDLLTKGILAKNNINKSDKAIKKAAFYKRKYILEYFLQHFSKPKVVYLLLRDFNIQYLSYLIKTKWRSLAKT
ncbi:glycosyltransferase family 2 protein [Pontibacter beigongshangensis]|uniref:glycosyltransferase family 2 protein n=1 Tax=Pontibacter beigongshangensis TaxID=2574733 RepID=UPI00164F4B8B|nr:glycosyltransferase [Pontibacter beigongshangensis]